MPTRPAKGRSAGRKPPLRLKPSPRTRSRTIAPDFHAVFDSAPSPLLLTLADDPVFTIAAANDAYIQVCGVAREQLLNRGLFEVFPNNPGDPFARGVDSVRASFQRVIATRSADRMPSFRYDVARSASQGGEFEERYWSTRNTPIPGADGTVQYILHSVEEVTDKVREEKQARTSTLGYMTGCIDGLLSYLNPAVLELLGFNEEEVAAGLVDWSRINPPEFAALDVEAMRRMLATGNCVPYEKELSTKDGRRVPVLVGASLLNQRKREVSVFVLDLTARQRAEAVLRQQWRTFDTALSHTPDFTYIFDLEGRFTYVNRALLSLWQKPLEEAVGKNFFELGYPPDLAAQLQSHIQRVIELREPLRDETPFTGPTGETRYYEYIFVPVLSASGVLEAVAGSTRDITDRRRDQEALRKSEERLTFALAAGGGVGTWDWDLPADRVYSDARFAQLFSVDPASGAPFSSYLQGIHPDDRERVARGIQQAIATGEDYVQEYRLQPRDGMVRWVFARGRCHRDETGQPVRFPGVVLDITDRKRAEEAVADSEARFRFLAETIPQMVWTATADGHLDYVSSQGTEYFGLPQAALLGTGWLSYVHPDDLDQTVERWKQSLATGAPYEVAFRLRRGSDGTFRWHLARALPLIGEVVQWFGTCTEIEDQKVIEAELTRTNRELEEFAYVASHDLQEPMRMVNIYTQLILMEIADSHPSLKEYGGFVREGVGRMQALIQDLLTFSRTVHKDQLPAGVADLSLSLTEALSVLDNRIRQSGATITVQPLPTVVGDTAQLAHVFQNLLSNALKYSKTGTPPRIDICVTPDGEQWIVSIQDNGIGFEPQYAERIFGLFKRLHKDEYEGTGLGLAICRRIIERYGGRMWAEGRPREGATFFFVLPGSLREPGRQT